jgi:hypothetical protein
MAGCFRGSVYSTRTTISRYLKDDRVGTLVTGRVRRIDPEQRCVEYEVDGSRRREVGFDKIFLAAGCPASTEILMRSFDLQGSLAIQDNAVYVFPIVFGGRLPTGASQEPYLALSNLILGCIPDDNQECFAQIQIYPNFDYLWRYNFGKTLWRTANRLFSRLGSRLMWGRLYMHSKFSQSYSISLKDDVAVYSVAHAASGEDHVRSVLHSLRAVLDGSAFYIPRLPPYCQKVNSHYAGTLPFGNTTLHVSASGEVAPGIYVCDSTCFPNSPAVSLTFTIMANAARVAAEARLN